MLPWHTWQSRLEFTLMLYFRSAGKHSFSHCHKHIQNRVLKKNPLYTWIISYSSLLNATQWNTAHQLTDRENGVWILGHCSWMKACILHNFTDSTCLPLVPPPRGLHSISVLPARLMPALLSITWARVLPWKKSLSYATVTVADRPPEVIP